jgi:hypothetical protein
MKAEVLPNRIDILGASALRREAWEPLLNRLKAEHVPSFTPTGKRMCVVVGPTGRLDAFIYRTAIMSDKEVVHILKENGIPADIGPTKNTEGICE